MWTVSALLLLLSGVEDLAAMARILTGLPWTFTVRNPPALAAALAAHVAALAQTVARSPHRGVPGGS